MPLILPDTTAFGTPALLATEHPYLATTLLVLGTLTAVRSIWGVFAFGMQTFLMSGRDVRKYRTSNDTWALVTGATDGIGLAFVHELVKKGFNVCLVSRGGDKLRGIASELGMKHANAKFDTVIVDFSRVDNGQWSALQAWVGSHDVGILVNNVGRSHEMPTDFAETADDEMEAIISINISQTLRITKLVLGGMISRKKGLILNLSSFAGALPSPMLATYSGSKAFLSTWSASLRAEVRPKGIEVWTYNTFFVVSNMSKIRRPTLFAPTATAFARAALSSVALTKSAAFSPPGVGTPYWSHALADWILGGLLALVGWDVGVQRVRAMHKGIRARALRKKEREAKIQ